MEKGNVDLHRLPGLRDLWARMTMLGPSGAGDVPIRPLLDTLGLGIEQTLRHLGSERPDFAAFVAWIETTAGPANPDRVARYEAWSGGAPPPPTELARQAAILSAEPVFTAAERARWDQDGVIVLRHAIVPDAAAAIAAHLWSLLRASPDDPNSWYAPRANGIMIQHFQHTSMDVPRTAPRIATAFAELYGHADLIASTDRLSFNPPERPGYRFPGPHLHWDGSLTPPIPFETQAILYLTDTAEHQGALQVVPGFHRRLAQGWLDKLGDDDPRTIDLSAEAVTVPGKAGDLVIWRHEIPHGATPNRADRPRLAQYVNYYPMHWADARPWL